MKKILLTVISVLIGISLSAQNSVSLKMNLEKNKTYRLKSVSEQIITQTVNGNQQTVNTKVNQCLSLKVMDVTPEFMVTEVHMDTMITNTNSMGKTININSTVDGDMKSSEMGDIMSCIMNRLSKNAIYAKMDFAGRPVEVVNSKMLSDLILKDTSTITLTGPMASALKTQITEVVSENTLKTMIGSFTWYLPDKEVSAGETWKITQQTHSGGMLLDIITSYHLDQVDGNFANITAESVIKPAANAQPIHSAGATVTYDNLQGLSKSNLVIDTRTGLIVDQKAKSHIAGDLSISAPGFSMQMPMDINGESKIISL